MSEETPISVYRVCQWRKSVSKIMELEKENKTLQDSLKRSAEACRAQESRADKAFTSEREQHDLRRKLENDLAAVRKHFGEKAFNEVLASAPPSKAW